MGRTKPVGLGRKQHTIRSCRQRIDVDHRIACLGNFRHRIPSHRSQRARDVGIARDTHPGVFPDQVQHPFTRQSRAILRGGVQRRRQALAKCFGRGRSAENAADQAIQFMIVTRPPGMGHDQVRRELANALRGLFLVFVDVDDHVGGTQFTQTQKIHILGTAHLGHALKCCARVDAKAGARHQLCGQAQCTHQFCDGWHQAGDACVGAGTRMQGALRVREQPLLAAEIRSAGCLRHVFWPAAARGLRALPASRRSNNPLGKIRSSFATIAICHGTTA